MPHCRRRWSTPRTRVPRLVRTEAATATRASRGRARASTVPPNIQRARGSTLEVRSCQFATGSQLTRRTPHPTSTERTRAAEGRSNRPEARQAPPSPHGRPAWQRSRRRPRQFARDAPALFPAGGCQATSPVEEREHSRASTAWQARQVPSYECRSELQRIVRQRLPPGVAHGTCR